MIKVLVADDEVLELEYLANLFEGVDGFELVGKADNGEQAVALDREFDPDVVILDINMPTGGLEAARQIRNESPDKIIIINTAYANFEYARKAVDMHLDGYLLKPSSSDEILETVRNCISRKGIESGRMDSHAVSHHAELYRLMENLINHVAQARAGQLGDDRDELISYMDRGNIWETDCSLFLINSVFRIRQQIEKLHFGEATLEFIGFDRSIEEIENSDSAGKRRAVNDLIGRVEYVIREGMNIPRDPVAFAKSYIAGHYAEEITLDHIAEMAHFSTGHMSRLFNKTTGVSLRTYINRVRIEQVIRELTETDKDVADIAMDCGFRNMSHFYRIFKEQTGSTPRRIRLNKETEMKGLRHEP